MVTHIKGCCVRIGQTDGRDDILVFLSGELQYKTWEKDGRTLSKHELLVDDVKMPDKAQQQGIYAEQQRFADRQHGEQGLYGDDICF